jgi:GNAT superfamily N-acetyltransferase
MVSVREIGPEDTRAMIELTRMMHAESPHYSPYPFREAKIKGLCQLCRDDDNWLCIIARDADGEAIGFAAVGAIDMLFCEDKSVDDLGLFVIPERRGGTTALRLMAHIQPWAMARAKQIRMGVTTGTNQHQAVSFFKKLGFEETGVLLTKKIN